MGSAVEAYRDGIGTRLWRFESWKEAKLSPESRGNLSILIEAEAGLITRPFGHRHGSYA